ncbi:MAG: carbohydrate kinase family protein [Chitinophagaceae bacterium]
MSAPYTHKKFVCFGEILWDVLPGGAQPGGAPMNVAYHLKKQGMEPVLISKVGKDIYGDDLVKILKNQNLNLQNLQLDEEQPTGIVHATPNANHEVSYDIVFPSAWDFIDYNASLSKLVEESDYFIFGSLAARNSISKNTLLRLLEAAQTKVLDINLRPPHYSRELVEMLLHKADFLKLNEDELRLISGWFLKSDDIYEQIKMLQNHFNLNSIVVTRGNKGAIFKKEKTFFQHPGFEVKVADTVGSGDAFLAGLLAHLSKGFSASASLEYANSLGAYIATRFGACPEYELTDVDVVKYKPV